MAEALGYFGGRRVADDTVRLHREERVDVSADQLEF
jgi:hypothetical protein